MRRPGPNNHQLTQALVWLLDHDFALARAFAGSKRGARPAALGGAGSYPAGFVWSIDRAAYRGYRAFRPAEDIWPAGVDPDAAADEVAGWLLALVDAIRNPATPPAV